MPEASCHAWHGEGDEVIEVAIAGPSNLCWESSSSNCHHYQDHIHHDYCHHHDLSDLNLQSDHLKGSEADVIQGLVVNHEGLVGVLDQLVQGQGGVVGLYHRVRHLGGHYHHHHHHHYHLWGGEDRECVHHLVWKLLSNLFQAAKINDLSKEDHH